MKNSTLIFFATVSLAFLPAANSADLPPEFVEAAEKARAEVPLGGDFRPDPKVPVFVAIGHGGRILLSRDDGKSWKEVFFGHPGSDHSPWAAKSVAYTEGVFAVAIGWGAPTAWLASEDGVNWRHLTDGETVVPGVRGAKEAPSIMAGTWGLAGAKGIFVSGGYMTTSATPDFGRSFTTFSLRSFKDDPRERKLVTHHVDPIWCGEKSGRFLAIGNDRSETPVFGNLYASDDLGKTWTWLEPKRLNEICEGYSGMVSNGRLVVIADKAGANLFSSDDAGDNWEGPFPTGLDRAGLSLVGDEFWLVGRKGARATSNGKTWRDLPEGIPTGQMIASPEGTLISIDRKRTSILRSTDGGTTWNEVYTFEAPDSPHIHGAQGLRDIEFGYITEKPVR